MEMFVMFSWKALLLFVPLLKSILILRDSNMCERVLSVDVLKFLISRRVLFDDKSVNTKDALSISSKSDDVT